MGLGKRVKRFATVADFIFQLTNDSFVVKYSSLFAPSVRAGEHLVPYDSHTVSFLRFTDSTRAYFLPLELRPYSSKYHDVRDLNLQVNRAKQLKFGFGLCAVRAC